VTENLGVITCNRPTILYRCLNSYAENAHIHGRRLSFFVADDSTKSVDRVKNKLTLKRISKETGFESYYAGIEEKIIFLKRMIYEADVPAEIIKFALFDIRRTGLGAYGANRNALMLGLTEKKFLFVDDDTECRIALPDKAGLNQYPKLIDSCTDPSFIRSFRDRREILDTVDFLPVDFFGAHNKYLGSTVENKRIRITLNGLLGDCGWGGSSKYLFLQDNVFKNFVKTDDDYDSVVCSREMLRSVLTPTLTNKVDDLMTTVFGVDNSGNLSPFFPVGRGEDIVFSQTLSTMLPNTGFLFLPGAILHQPVEPRSFRKGEILRSSSGIDLSILLFELLGMMGADNLIQVDSASLIESEG